MTSRRTGGRKSVGLGNYDDDDDDDDAAAGQNGTTRGRPAKTGGRRVSRTASPDARRECCTVAKHRERGRVLAD